MSAIPSPPITGADMAVLKLTYTPEEFDLLDMAMTSDPALVKDFVTKVKPKNSTDIAAYDRIICSLFVHARNEYDFEDALPTWGEQWFDKYWPSQPYRDFYDISIFDQKSRYNGISLVTA